MDNKQENTLAELKRAYITCFSTDAGKKVLEDLERRCFFNAPSFVPGDPYTSIFNEGTRANVLYMKSMIALDISKLKELERQDDAGS